MKNTKKQKGYFGILEMTGVAALLTVVGYLAISNMDKTKDALRTSVLKSQIVKLAEAQETEYALTGRYVANDDQTQLMQVGNIYARDQIIEPSVKIFTDGADNAQKITLVTTNATFTADADMYIVCNPDATALDAAADTTSPVPVCNAGEVIQPSTHDARIPGELFTVTLYDRGGQHANKNFVAVGLAPYHLYYINSLGVSNF